MTHRSTSQRGERNQSAPFHASSQPGSESSGRPDQTRSDSTHLHLNGETKFERVVGPHYLKANPRLRTPECGRPR